MKIILNEAEKKPLVTLFGERTNTKPQYLRTPSYGCQIGGLLLTRGGSIGGPNIVSQAGFNELFVILNASGYCPKKADLYPTQKSEVEAASTEETEPIITIPLKNVNVGSLINLLDAKEFLIKHVLYTNDLRFGLSEDSISFPWSSELPEPDEVHAHSTLIAALCKTSRNQERISAMEKPVDNERYASRCFLLCLGFIGDECKTSRRILTRYLPGNGIFKGGEGHAISK